MMLGALYSVVGDGFAGVIQSAGGKGGGVGHGHPVTSVGARGCGLIGNAAWISCSVGWFAVISGGVRDACKVCVACGLG